MCGRCPISKSDSGTAYGTGQTPFRSYKDVLLLNPKAFLTHAFSAFEQIPGLTAAVKTSYGIETAVVAGTGFLTFIDICQIKQSFHYTLLGNLD